MPDDTISILLADDNADLGQLIQDIFRVYRRKHAGPAIDFDYVPGAVEAVDAAKLKVYDLILMDYQMPPGPDGVWATGEIKKITAGTPVIFLSAYTHRADLRAAERAGATGYIAKTIFSQPAVIRCLIARDWESLRLYSDSGEVWVFDRAFSGQPIGAKN